MRKLIWLASVLLAGAVLYGVVGEVRASRNSGGTMAGINGPYTTLTTISSTAVNARLADIENEITNSLERNGKGGMLAALRGIDGTVAAPAFSWTSETGSGLFRNGTNDVRMSIGGTSIEKWTASGPTALKPFQGTLGVGAVGAGTQLVELVGSSEPAITIQNTSMTNSPLLFMGMNSGNSAAVFQTQGATNFGFKYINGAGTSLFTIGATGAVTTPVSLTIGTGGTAMTLSLRGTTSWTPGTVSAGNVQSTTITLTGAVAGADCLTSGPSSTSPLALSCRVTTDTCTIILGDTGTSGFTGPSGTYSCRVFNP